MLTKDCRKKIISNPLSKRILNRINKIEKKLKKQKLNRDFIIDEERYLFPEKNIIQRGIEIFTGDQMDKPLPEGFSEKPPQPVVNTTQMANKDPITNLTATEEALLSPTDKVIAGRT